MPMHSVRFFVLALAAVFLAAPSVAQSGTEVEVDRPELELRDALVDPVDPADPDAVETALVFTSAGGPAAVRCTARDYEGAFVGAIVVPVPAGGLRYVRASDLADGADFVGSAHCTSLGAVAGSAFLLGPRGATDLPATQYRERIRGRRHAQRHRLHFPVVASY